MATNGCIRLTLMNKSQSNRSEYLSEDLFSQDIHVYGLCFANRRLGFFWYATTYSSLLYHFRVDVEEYRDLEI